jgi:PHD/YefM family antitoxin component YafN of YafNO toxin-antitoxin module
MRSRTVAVLSCERRLEWFWSWQQILSPAVVTLITRRRAQDAVVMSLDTYIALMETVHLLRSPANAAPLSGA